MDKILPILAVLILNPIGISAILLGCGVTLVFTLTALDNKFELGVFHDPNPNLTEWVVESPDLSLLKDPTTGKCIRISYESGQVTEVQCEYLEKVKKVK